MKKSIVLFLILLAFAANLCAQTESGPVKHEMSPEFEKRRLFLVSRRKLPDCCEIHDKAYYFGGSWKMRLKADNKLFKCVAKKKGWYPTDNRAVYVGGRSGFRGFVFADEFSLGIWKEKGC